MSFLSKNQKSRITVEVSIPADKLDQFTTDLTTLLSNVSADTINLLAKASKNKILMPMAIAKLKEHIQ